MHRPGELRMIPPKPPEIIPVVKPKPYEPNYAVHPGQTLLECILYQFAYELITKKPFLTWNGKLPEEDNTIHELAQELLTIIQEQAPITETLVGIFPKGFPTKTFWLNYQTNYEKDVKRIAKCKTYTQTTPKKE